MFFPVGVNAQVDSLDAEGARGPRLGLHQLVIALSHRCNVREPDLVSPVSWWVLPKKKKATFIVRKTILLLGKPL